MTVIFHFHSMYLQKEVKSNNPVVKSVQLHCEKIWKCKLMANFYNDNSVPILVKHMEKATQILLNCCY